MKKYKLIDAETGEVIEGNFKIVFADNVKNIDTTLCVDDLDVDNTELTNYLMRYLKGTAEMNGYQQIKMSGYWLDLDLYNDVVELGLEKEFSRLIMLLANNENKIKFDKDSKKTVRNWTELYSALKVYNDKKGRFKRFCQKHDLIRQYGIVNSGLGDKKYMYVNPTKIRRGVYVGYETVTAFKDYTLRNIHRYSVYFLHQIKLIDKSDINKYV